jgi:hypothetical protein
LQQHNFSLAIQAVPGNSAQLSLKRVTGCVAELRLHALIAQLLIEFLSLLSYVNSPQLQ